MQIGFQTLLRQNLPLHGKDCQIAANPVAVTQQSQPVRLAHRVQRQLLLPALRLHRTYGGEPVGDVAQGIAERLVVLADGRVVARTPARQAASEPPALENRQADRRTDADDVAAGLEQLIQSDTLQTGKGQQVDVGIELRPGDFDIPGSRFHPPALRDDIRSTTDKIRWQS